MSNYTDTNWDSAAFRRRATAFAIALAIEALLFLAILSLGLQSGPKGKTGTRLTAFNLEDSAKANSKSQTNAQANTAANPNVVRQTQPIPPPIIPSKNPLKLAPPSKDFIKVSKADFDAMDISKLPANQSSGSDDANGAGRGSKGPMGPGAGPGGAQLYPVAWYREPYDSELAPYLSAIKRIPPGATAEIACRMIEHNRVENCQILSENPRGTGLAKALRLAAWQFLVKPPRIDSKPQLGVWVRIHFDFGVKETSDEAE